MPACVVNSPTHLHDRGQVQADVAACSLAGARPKRQLNIALGILLPAPMLAQEDEQGCAAAAYHQLLRLSVCPSAAY